MIGDDAEMPPVGHVLQEWRWPPYGVDLFGLHVLPSKMSQCASVGFRKVHVGNGETAYKNVYRVRAPSRPHRTAYRMHCEGLKDAL